MTTNKQPLIKQLTASKIKYACDKNQKMSGIVSLMISEMHKEHENIHATRDANNKIIGYTKVDNDQIDDSLALSVLAKFIKNANENLKGFITREAKLSISETSTDQELERAKQLIDETNEEIAFYNALFAQYALSNDEVLDMVNKIKEANKSNPNIRHPKQLIKIATDELDKQYKDRYNKEYLVSLF